MNFSSNLQSRIHTLAKEKLSSTEHEWSWVKFGSLSLFSFNDANEIPVAKENIPIRILLLSDKSFTETPLLEKYNYLYNDVFVGRLENGDICCCAIYNDEIVSYCWVAKHKAYIGEIGKEISLKEKEIYLYDAFTQPEFRGNNLFPKILTSILNYGKLKGYQKALIFALSSNNSSVVAIKKAGFEIFQSVHFLYIYGKTFCKFGEVKNGELGIEERFIKEKL